MDLKQEIEKIFEHSEAIYDNDCIYITNQNIKEQYCDYYDFIRKIENIKEITKQDNKIVSCIYFIKFNFSHSVFQLNNNENINLSFQCCKFDKIYSYQINHNGEYIFDKCDINSINFSKSFSHIIKFKNCKIKKVKIHDCKILNRLSFYKSTFESDFHFENCKVKNLVNFSNAKFVNNAYFNNTEFLGYADFHEAEFEVVACFYGAKFEKPMNFSSAIFKDFNKTDFVNLNIENINLENINSAVEKNYKDESYKEEKFEIDNNSKENKKEKKIKELDLKYKIRWANNFRDSFRTIKHSLIETNNNLEASNFHKLELYAKEIELEYQIEKENPNFATQENKKIEYKKENHKFNIKNLFILLAIIIAILAKPIWVAKFIISAIVIFLSPILTFLLLFILLFFLYYSLYCIYLFWLFINSKTYKDAINFVIYHIQIFYNSINKYINKEHFKDMLDYTKYIDYWKIRIYKDTSEHHTNFTRILNFTIAMISLYGLFILLINKTTAQTSTQFMTINIVFTIFIMLVFVYFAYALSLSIVANMGLFLILMLVCVTKIFSLTILSFYGEITFFAVLYLLSVLLLYRLFIVKNNLITFAIRVVSYIGFLFMIYISPSIVLPFANLNSQEFKTKYLENNISEANKTEIIDLASIINQEFNATKNPNSSENLSISELNEYKKFIVENKEILKDSNATNAKFKQAIYADSSRDKTIKCISFIYAIILCLCLFSLQKTARRNSVVPS